MNTTTRGLLAALITGAAGGVAAQDPATPASTALPEGWYVAPMATYYSPDAERCGTDSKVGVAAALGHRGEIASVEVWAQHLEVPYASCAYTYPTPTQVDPNATTTVVEPSGELKLNGGGVGLLVGPFSAEHWYTRLYGLVAIGVLQRENRVQDPNDDSTIIGDIGGGYLQPLRLWERDVFVRLEARYRYDLHQPPHPEEDYDPPVRHGYNDVVVNLGLQVPLSAAPEAAPAPEPVAVVAPASGDADNDGVNDDRDQCPDTPADSYVNNVGCPAAITAPAETTEPDSEPVLETAKAGDTIVLKGVTFETGKARLRADSATILDGVVETLGKRPELRIEVGGHTDNRGADAYNQSLSQQRADAVLSYLVAHGVDAGRLSAVGYGESTPVETNDTDEGRERNRRVELKVLPTDQSNTGEGS